MNSQLHVPAIFSLGTVPPFTSCWLHSQPVLMFRRREKSLTLTVIKHWSADHPSRGMVTILTELWIRIKASPSVSQTCYWNRSVLLRRIWSIQCCWRRWWRFLSSGMLGRVDGWIKMIRGKIMPSNSGSSSTRSKDLKNLQSKPTRFLMCLLNGDYFRPQAWAIRP